MDKMDKQKIDTPENRHRLLAVLSSHIGKINAISMTALYEEVFDATWANRVNDTRPIRKLITDLKDDGIPICSNSSRNSGGYYLAAAGSELADFLHKDKCRALRIHKRDVKILKTSLPNYLGQLKIEAEAEK